MSRGVCGFWHTGGIGDDADDGAAAPPRTASSAHSAAAPNQVMRGCLIDVSSLVVDGAPRREQAWGAAAHLNNYIDAITIVHQQNGVKRRRARLLLDDSLCSYLLYVFVGVLSEIEQFTNNCLDRFPCGACSGPQPRSAARSARATLAGAAIKALPIFCLWIIIASDMRSHTK